MPKGPQQIELGDDATQVMLRVDDRKGVEVVSFEEAPELLKRGLRSDGLWVSSHDVPDQLRFDPSMHLEPPASIASRESRVPAWPPMSSSPTRALVASFGHVQ
jgi:hypothetical protein